MMCTGCYNYLSARHTLQLKSQTAAFTTFTYVILDTLLISFLAQVLIYANGWQWFWPWFFPNVEWMARPAAVVLLLGTFSFLLLRISGFTLEKLADVTGTITINQLRHTNWISFGGAGLLWILCFALWDQLDVLIKDVFAIPPLRTVSRGGYKLLTSGYTIANSEKPVWPDVAVSAQELAEGLLLSGIIAFIAAKMCRAVARSRLHSSWLLAVTHTVPIPLAVSLLPWIGVGHWFKGITVATVSCLPFLQSLWGLREQPFLSRILMALDNALPYAFLGMLFGEIYAATAGLGFFIVVARAEGYRVEALATSLIAFGLMVVVSLTLRFVAKILSASRPQTI
jgi:ABC-type nitrate/sulfonate/bicarbonate transport system permease component